jgi:hypothetical protein
MASFLLAVLREEPLSRKRGINYISGPAVRIRASASNQASRVILMEKRWQAYLESFARCFTS